MFKTPGSSLTGPDKIRFGQLSVCFVCVVRFARGWCLHVGAHLYVLVSLFQLLSPVVLCACVSYFVGVCVCRKDQCRYREVHTGHTQAARPGSLAVADGIAE
jgi:hypothetical protein